MASPEAIPASNAMCAENSDYLPFAHPQGWGQVDFGEVLYYGSDEQQYTGYALNGSFPYSNKVYTQVFSSRNQKYLGHPFSQV